MSDTPRIHAARSRRAGVIVCTAALLALLPFATAFANGLDDAAADRIVAAGVIPDATRKVGQVRLLARGDAVVVQTLLSTKLLTRVIAEVRKKEALNWPAGDESVTAYLAAFEAARQTVEKRDPGPDGVERRRRVLIEFAADAFDQAVMVGTFEFASDGEEALPRSREIFQTLALPRAYVLRNMRLIVADSFHVAEADVDRVGSLGPASPSAGHGAAR